jgi:hypothetical protein
MIFVRPKRQEMLLYRWDCGAGHQHGTEKTAQRCIDKQRKAKAIKKNMRKKLERNAKLIASKPNDSELIADAAIGARAKKALSSIGLKTRGDVRAYAAKDGDSFFLNSIRNLPIVGRNTAWEIELWLMD